MLYLQKCFAIHLYEKIAIQNFINEPECEYDALETCVLDQITQANYTCVSTVDNPPKKDVVTAATSLNWEENLGCCLSKG